MTWSTCRLGDVVTLQRGHDLPDSRRKDGEVPVVSSSGITGWHSESKGKVPGVVTGRYGTLGEVFYLEQDYWPLNTALYVTDFKGNHPRFVAYFLRNLLANYQSDKAAVPGVNRNVLHELKVRRPSASAQAGIVEVLGAYDDLIDTNRRRILLLEEAARQLYREWFVRLCFPGHEHTRITNGIPENWKSTPLFEVAIPTYGHPFQSAMFQQKGEGVPVARIRDVLAGESSTYTLEDAPVDRRLQNGDMLVGMDGNFHMGLWAGGEAWLNQRVVRLRSVGMLDDYLLFNLLRDPIRVLNETITGTTVIHLGAKELKEIRLILPPHVLLKHAGDLFAPLGRELVLLKLQNRNLRAASDLLLPRLMSGALTV